MQANYEAQVDTTVGELVEALSDAALEIYENQRVAYFYAALALKVILKKSQITNATGTKHPAAHASSEDSPCH